MATLQAMGAPIRGEAGVGYQMEKGYFLPPLHFDPDELDALILGLKLISVQGDGALTEASTRVSSKITTALLERDQDTFSRSPLNVFATASTQIAPAPYLQVVRTSLRKRTRIVISYVDGKNQTSTRTIRPIGLTIFDTIWLLTTWCELRNDFRNFRIDRIQSVTDTHTAFPREAGREFADFLKTL